VVVGADRALQNGETELVYKTSAWLYVLGGAVSKGGVTTRSDLCSYNRDTVSERKSKGKVLFGRGENMPTWTISWHCQQSRKFAEG
jgi:hypothetical protein